MASSGRVTTWTYVTQPTDCNTRRWQTLHVVCQTVRLERWQSDNAVCDALCTW